MPALTTLAARRVASLHDARTARAARRLLREELDSYRSPAERAELEAVLARHSDADLERLSALTGRHYGAA